jgi:hypothetical protein
MIEVNEVEQYRNLATVREANGRKVITLAIKTDLDGKALEVAIAEMLNTATVIEFQISEIARHQPHKIDYRHDQLQPRRSTMTVNAQTIEKIVEAKRRAAGDTVIDG